MFRLSHIQSAFRRTRHMAAISTLPLTFAMIGVSSDPAMAANGVSPSALANAVDQKIEQFRRGGCKCQLCRQLLGRRLVRHALHFMAKTRSPPPFAGSGDFPSSAHWLLKIAARRIGRHINVWRRPIDHLRNQPPGFWSRRQTDMLVTKSSVDAGLPDLPNQGNTVRC